MAINVGSMIAMLDLDTGQFSTKLAKAQTQVNGFSEKIKSYGGAFEDLGKGLTMGITAPVVGLGVAAGKTGMDFEAGMSRVQAISGATKTELGTLSEQALQLGADTVFSASEVAGGMENLASAGFNANEIMAAMPGLLDLAAVSGGDVAQSSDVAASALRGFGLEASEAGHVADVFARAAADTNAETADMGEAMKYIAPVAHAMGLSLEETAAAVGIMSDAGVKGGQAGTTLRGALSRLAKPTKTMKEAMSDLGISFYDSEGKMVSLKDQIGILQDATKGMTQEQKNQLLVTLYGQESLSGMLALIDAGPEKLGNLTTSLEDSSGAAQEMANTMMDNTKGSWEEMMGALETAGIKVFQAMAPTITKAAEKIGELADKFSNLNPKTQETIVKLAGIAAAIGPVLVVGGKMANGIGSIVGLFSKFGAGANIATTAASALGGVGGLGSVITTGTEAGGVIASLGGAAGGGGILSSLTSGLGTSLAAMGPWALGIAAAGTAAYGLYKYLSEDSLPAVQIFDDTISEGTQKAVGSFLDMEQQATTSLNQLSWSGQEVTGEMAKSITNNFSVMAKQIVTKLEEQKTGALDSLSEMVNNSKSMTEDEKNEILKITGEKYDEQIKKTEDGNKRIVEILNNAKNNNRSITDAERNEINKIKEEMKQTGIRVLSESEKEQLAIMERLKQESGNISAQQAAEVVKNSKEQKEKTIAEAEKEYQERLKYAAQLRAEGSDEAIKMADKIAEEAKRQRDEAVQKAKEMHNNVVEEAKKQSKEHVDEIDWETGEVMSKWDKAVRWFKNNPIVRWIKEQGEDPARKLARQRRIDPLGLSGYASGTDNAEKGWKLVGEEGPELMFFKGGETVLPHEKTREIFGQGGTFGIGQNIIKGLSSGMMSLEDEVAATVEYMANMVNDTFKKEMGISSPSKVFEEYGENLNKGLVTGIKDTNEVKKTTEDVAALIKKTFESIQTDIPTPKINIDEGLVRQKSSQIVSRGESEEFRYKDTIAKMNQDELEKTKEILDNEYEYQVSLIDKKLQKTLEANTKETEEKAKALRESREQLEQNYNFATSLIESQTDKISDAAEKTSDKFTVNIDKIDKSIDMLSEDTEDLTQKLTNQNAIVELQKEKIKQLEVQYNQLSNEFGTAADATEKAKDELEKARTALKQFGKDVEDTKEKIKQAEEELRNEQIEAVNNMVSRIKQALKEKYEAEKDAQEKAIQEHWTALDKWQKESLERINSVYDAKIKKIDETSNAQIEALQKEIDALDTAEEQKTREQQDQEELRQISNLEQAIEYEHNEFNKSNLQKQLQKATTEREERLRKQQIEDRKLALQQEITDIKNNADQQKAILEQKKNEEIENINSIYEHEKETLENRLEDIQAFYAQKLLDTQLQAEAEKMIIDNQQQEIIELLHSYEEPYKQAGESLGEKLLEGFQPKIDEIQSMINGVYKSLSGLRSNTIDAMVATSSDNILSDNSGSLGGKILVSGGSEKKEINNEFNFYSPKALSPSEQRRQFESSVRKLSFTIT